MTFKSWGKTVKETIPECCTAGKPSFNIKLFWCSIIKFTRNNAYNTIRNTKQLAKFFGIGNHLLKKDYHSINEFQQKMILMVQRENIFIIWKKKFETITNLIEHFPTYIIMWRTNDELLNFFKLMNSKNSTSVSPMTSHLQYETHTEEMSKPSYKKSYKKWHSKQFIAIYYIFLSVLSF